MIIKAQVRKDKLTTFKVCKSLNPSKLNYYPIQVVFAIEGERFAFTSRFVTTNKDMQCPMFNDIDKSEVENLENSLALSKLLETCKDFIENHPRLSMLELRHELMKLVKGKNVSEIDDTFASYIEQEVIPNKGTDSTKEKYRSTVKHIRDFDETVTFDTLTKGWLKQFEEEMRRVGKSPNTIHLQLRNIRAAFNQAISDEVTDCKSPFLVYKMPKAKNKKPAFVLTDQQFADFRDYPVSKEFQPFKDFVLLSFYLGGINPVDILTLKSLTNGRVRTSRTKTGSNIDLPVPEEAMEIIKRHRGKKLLLDFIKNGTAREVGNFVKMCDKHIKHIGLCTKGATKENPHAKMTYKGIFPELTIYTFRRSFASIAAELDEPTENIALTLAHKQVSSYTITEVYIVRSHKKIDHCVSTVIEHLRTIQGRSKEEIDKEVSERA